MGFIKPRTLPGGGRSFAGQANHTKAAATRTRDEFVPGTYDSWYPSEPL